MAPGSIPKGWRFGTEAFRLKGPKAESQEQELNSDSRERKLNDEKKGNRADDDTHVSAYLFERNLSLGP